MTGVVPQPEQPWTIDRVVRWATDDFRSRGLDSPRLDAELLVCHALTIDRMTLLLDPSRPLTPAELGRYRALHKRRRAGEPIAYLRGVREFYGRPFRVDARVLVPRPETELLVEVALNATRHVELAMRALDLCTGSGCVAITLSRERPTARVAAVDISPGALDVARLNAQTLGSVPRTAFLLGDLYSPLGATDRFDVITANAPYVPQAELVTLQRDVRDFEPHLALGGGDDGLAIVRRIVAGAAAFLVPGGTLALEVGAGQAPAVAECLQAAGFVDVRSWRDLAGWERVVSARTPLG